MGAGSAKGVNAGFDDDDDLENDRFSIGSQDSPKPISKLNKPPIIQQETLLKPKNTIKPTKTTIPDLNDDDDEEDMTQEPPNPPIIPSEGEKKEEKRKGLLGFSIWKDDEAKTNAFVHEEEKNKNKENSKGFKFFTWKKDGKKESVEKDEHLDQEINDLQKTFDSLGILGRTLNGEGNKKNRKSKSQSADDIRNLEPMRNRINAKRGAVKPITARKGSEGLPNYPSGGNNRRTFKYSWETDGQMITPVTDQDQWSYQSVVIAGFDIEKFKKANLNDSLIENNISGRIPNSVSDNESPTRENGSLLTYDPTEQKLLATIERDFAI